MRCSNPRAQCAKKAPDVADYGVAAAATRYGALCGAAPYTAACLVATAYSAQREQPPSFFMHTIRYYAADIRDKDARRVLSTIDAAIFCRGRQAEAIAAHGAEAAKSEWR